MSGSKSIDWPGLRPSTSAAATHVSPETYSMLSTWRSCFELVMKTSSRPETGFCATVSASLIRNFSQQFCCGAGVPAAIASSDRESKSNKKSLCNILILYQHLLWDAEPGSL